jgi:hypothetical protein
MAKEFDKDAKHVLNRDADDDCGMHTQKKGFKKDKPDLTRGMKTKDQPKGKGSPVLEDAEHITELSKKTLGNYVKRAASSAMDNSYANASEFSLGNEKKANKAFHKGKNRFVGIHRAVNRLQKEETEMSLKDAVNFGIEGKLDDMREVIHQAMYEKAVASADNLKQNVAASLFAEEQIDEISKNTMGRYIRKASADMQKKQGYLEADKFAGHKLKPRDKVKVTRDVRNRSKGLNTAADKITKEETDPLAEARSDSVSTGVLTELSSKKVSRYISRASHSIADMRLASDRFVAAGARRRKAVTRFRPSGDPKPHEDEAKKLSDKANRRSATVDKVLRTYRESKDPLA